MLQNPPGMVVLSLMQHCSKHMSNSIGLIPEGASSQSGLTAALQFVQTFPKILILLLALLLVSSLVAVVPLVG